nr:IclR family transcriptional regulator [Sphingomonas sp. CDS-1]
MAVRNNKTDEADTPPSGGVDAVDRALAILASFRMGHERQTLAELAVGTGFYKSTILRLARSLEVAGFLHRDEAGVFAIGPEPLRLAALFRNSLGLEARVRPVLRTLREEAGESASFFRCEGNLRQCLYREEPRRAVRDHLMEGEILPLNVGAAGHVMSVFGNPVLTEGERERRFAELPFISSAEHDPETAALAAPVFDTDGLAGALTISGPSFRLTPARARELGSLLLAQAETLSRLLGGGDWPADAGAGQEGRARLLQAGA